MHESPIFAESTEHVRLTKLFDRLRDKLLDMRLSNPMLNYKHRSTSKRQLQIVDEVPEEIFRLLVTEGEAADVLPLDEPEGIPPDEQTEDFRAEFEHAKNSDVEYLTQIAALEASGRDDEFTLAEAETQLRARLREKLGLPPRPSRKTISPIEHARTLGIDPSLELNANATKDSHKDVRFQTLKWPDTLEATLEKITDDARLAEQEMGLSTLFLAFGFLEWAEAKDVTKRLFAPLLLLPVKLDKRKTTRGKIVFTLSATASEADNNLSLAKKLLNDFGLKMPEFEPQENANTPVEEYFAAVNRMIADQPGWRVRRWMTLGHFAFGRFAMYADLDPSNWEIHPVADELVGAVVRGTEISGDGGVGLTAPPDDYAVDLPEIEAKAPYLVHDADASQHSAIVDVMTGKNLVIQGPPGTGKSQTITNVIANALAVGKKVLFLTEKMAALDVVKRRLDAVELGHFCLELHSDKASSKEVVQSLKLRNKLGYQPLSDKLIPDVTFNDARQSLNEYVKSLHADGVVGKPFDQFWRAIRTRADFDSILPEFRKISFPPEIIETAAGFETAFGRLSQFAHVMSEFDKSYCSLNQSPWTVLTFSDDANAGMAYGLVDHLENFARSLGDLNASIAMGAAFGWRTVDDLETAFEIEAALPTDVPDDEWISLLAEHDFPQVQTLLEATEGLERLKAAFRPVEGFEPVGEAKREIARDVLLNLSPDQKVNKPADLYALAANTQLVIENLRSAIDVARPALARIGFDDQFPAAGLSAARVLAVIVDKTPQVQRSFIFASYYMTLDECEAAEREWRELVQDESRWRGRFSGAQDEWPAPAVLLAAAEARRKTGISGMIGSFGADGKVLATVHQSLGLPTSIKLTAEDYAALGAHAQRLGAFKANKAYEQKFGALWSGLDTPIGDILTHLRTFLSMRDVVAASPGGIELLKLIEKGSSEAFDLIVESKESLLPWSKLDQATREMVKEASLADVDAKLVNLAFPFKKILELDVTRSLQGVNASWRDIECFLDDSRDLAKAQEEVESHPLNGLAPRFQANPGAVRAAMDWLAKIDASDVKNGLRERLRSQGATEARSLLASACMQVQRTLAQARDELASMEREFGVAGLSFEAPERLHQIVSDLASRRDELSQFLSVRTLRVDCCSAGLEEFLLQAERLGIDTSGLPGLFKGLVAQQRAERIRRHDAVLSKVSGLQLDAKRGEFMTRDRLRMDQGKKAVYNAVIVNKPLPGSNFGPKKNWTESAALNNEFGKERGFRPVRELMRQAGASIQSMKPCFMMSPLSLAKFIPAERLSFDLLVIDEASQMRPEDALGGLLRAKQIVVVGDPKQLPPTDFFQRTSTDSQNIDEELESDGDDESILESCHKTFRQLRLLRWHYRSRCESLIAFSNREIYAPEGRQLITFPVARPGSFSIDRIRVQGAYEAKRNAPEAQRIASEAVRFMKEHADADQPPTLGIVAMNSDQTELILEELRLLASGDESVERYREKVSGVGEPVFVKNLENVQGDERDYILISMTYGPKQGERVVLQRFGPITHRQGDRRLNVLFTRARRRIGLITSMDSSDVKPTETSSRGVHLLQRYLAYVEGAGREAGIQTNREPDSDFEIHVAERLRAKGFSVAYQVGVSGFRIDLGVLNREHEGHFLAGIECDGAQYHSSKSARDRDRLRQEVLEGLGWVILRVWSTDWFDNPDRQTEILVRQLQEAAKRSAPAGAGYSFARAGDTVINASSPTDGGRLDDIPVDASPSSSSNLEPIIGSASDSDTKVRSEPDAPLPNATEPPWLKEYLSPSEGRAALAAYRDIVIAPAVEMWEPERSILRSDMIEALIEQRITEERDWFAKLPLYMRRNTNRVEKKQFFEHICEIVARVTV